MRLIDADALLEKLEFFLFGDFGNYNALGEAIVDAPTVEPPLDEPPLAAEHQKCWIPVGERLPENSEPVLVTYNWLQDSYEVLIGEYWGKTTEECPEEEKGWGCYGDYVTAWMPLPEPYKGGEDE